MATAAKTIAVKEKAQAVEADVPATVVRSLRTKERNNSRQEEARRRKWGVETRAVRSVHVRKF